GIAVLRYDKRGVGQSTGDYAGATTEDFAADALSGVRYLKSRKEIDARRIGLIGHSEGGLIAPMAAAQSPDIAFIVMLAGTGINGEQILYRQSELIARAAGAPEKTIAAERSLQAKVFHVVLTEKNPAKAQQEVIALLRSAQMTPEQRAALGGDAGLAAQAKALTSPWFRFFLTYDPVTALSKVQCPVLALDGSNDLQVPAKVDLDAISAALRKGGNRDFTVKEMPGLNHLFQTCRTGAISEYGKIEETISPTALKTIGDWIRKRVQN
ncbi:MAG TPA: alpha/beta hydrolase, partial [Chthonomonadales bacterium]|nr:alpha/beta hydrolase [Chthonomonadales bacterium]